MSFRTLMVISAVLAVGFGVAFTLLPAPVASLYGLTLDSGGVFLGRLLGAEFLGYGLLAWFVRNAADSDMRRSILLAFCITDALGFVLALIAQLSGIMNVLGWSIPAIFLLLASGFGYFRFAVPDASIKRAL